MNIASVFGELRKDKAAARVLLVFAACALTITGHFISMAANGAHSGGNGESGAVGAGGIALVERGDMPGGAAGEESASAAGGAAGGGALDGEDGGRAAGQSGDGGDGGEQAGQGGAAGAGDGQARAGGGDGQNGAQGGEAGSPAGAQGGSDLADGARRYVAGSAPESGGAGDPARVYIYVTGAVRNPGVYELERMSMVVDAVEAAGGFTDEADAENVNMVFRLENNAMLNIKRKPAAPVVGGGASEGDGSVGGAGGAGSGANGGSGSSSTGSKAAPASGAVAVGADAGPQGSGATVTEGYDGVLVSAGGQTGDGAAGQTGGSAGGAARPVNINTADEQELATLPGIGLTTAGKIVEYRNASGRFSAIEDLMGVSGIKEAKFNALKDRITV
jgi:competence protein ComEA